MTADACDEARVVAFLVGDLDDDEAAAFDAHLLDCDACWTVVGEDRRGHAAAESLRERAPSGLRDRIAAGPRAEPNRRPRRRALSLVVAGLVAVVALTGATALVGRGSRPADPSPVAMVVRLAQAGSASGGEPSALQVWRADSSSGPVVVAESSSPFPMPAGARIATLGDSEVWVAKRGGVHLLCLMSPRHALLAGQVPDIELQAVARAYGLLA